MKKYTDEGSDFIREIIGDIIFTMLQEKAFDEISVSDICKQANVGRTTYYRYYGAKTGKRDALLFWLVFNLQKKLDEKPDIENKKDIVFMDFLYDTQDRMRILKNNGLMDVIDELVFYLYGPKKEDDISMFYTKYVGAGLWVGLVRSVLDKDFCDDKETVQKNIAIGIMNIFKSR